MTIYNVNYMKRLVRLVLPITIAFVFLGVLPSSVLAHTLKSDGSIGAVIHINPEDDPIAGEPSSFFFEIKDKQKRFKPELCGCTVRIYKDTTELLNTPLYNQSQTASLDESSFDYTFPSKGIYTIKVVGKPIQTDAFQLFTLTYDIRVEREVNPASNTTVPATQSNFRVHWYHYLGIAVITIVFLIFLFIDRIRGRSQHKSNSTTTFSSWIVLFFVSVLIGHVVSTTAIQISHQQHGHDITVHARCMPQPIDATPAIFVTPVVTTAIHRPQEIVSVYKPLANFSINNKSPPLLLPTTA